LLDEQANPNAWIRSFSNDTLMMELVNDNGEYRYVAKYLPYAGPIPPGNWGRFDPYSQYP
jgi:hypothetical protein